MWIKPIKSAQVPRILDFGEHTRVWTSVELFPTEDRWLTGEGKSQSERKLFKAGASFVATDVVRYLEHPRHGNAWTFTVGSIRFEKARGVLFETAEDWEADGIWSFLDKSHRRHHAMISPLQASLQC